MGPVNDYFCLKEKTYNIDSDIDLIYNSLCKDFVDDFKNHKLKNLSSYIKDNLLQNDLHKYIKDCKVFNFISSKLLKTESCKIAHSKNPILIVFGFGSESKYIFGLDPKIIYIHLDVNAVMYEIKRLEFNSPLSHMNKRFKNIVSENAIKSSIAHELSHWVDDSLYELFDKILSNKDGILLRQKDVNITYFEIQAQIHGIEKIKKLYKIEYDLMTFDDLFIALPSLGSIAESLYIKYGKDVFLIWLKFLTKRMSRENLLGKSMINVDYSYFKDLQRLISTKI